MYHTLAGCYWMGHRPRKAAMAAQQAIDRLKTKTDYSQYTLNALTSELATYRRK